MPPNQKIQPECLPVPLFSDEEGNDDLIRCAILGLGMMGQEHVSYIMGYPKDVRIDYIVDPYQPSLDKALKVVRKLSPPDNSLTGDSQTCFQNEPTVLSSESELLQHANEIDLLVIATPNYLHTASLVKWGAKNLTILVEKPVAVSWEQHNRLKELSEDPTFKARIWVAMEYRYMPAIAKLLSLIPSTIGDLKMVSIRENRYPFLHKIGAWNRDPQKTGDTLVEKCCHFFDLFRVITSQEVALHHVRAIAQRGLNYQDETPFPGVEKRIIDSAFVTMPFQAKDDIGCNSCHGSKSGTIGCLELCMFAEGSRHQEEIIVTGSKVSHDCLSRFYVAWMKF